MNTYSMQTFLENSAYDYLLADKQSHVLNNSLVLDDGSLARLSYKLQPPQNHAEKAEFHRLFNKN